MKYIALLRAINVGGNRIVKMEKLRELFAEIGFTNVSTYIQSGNVIFETPESNRKNIQLTIETKLKESLGFEVDIILRTPEEFKEIIKAKPFSEFENDEKWKLYVAFLSENPTVEAQKSLVDLNNSMENYKFIGAELFVAVDKNNLKQIFTNNYIEKKLNVISTTRNWNVVNRLARY